MRVYSIADFAGTCLAAPPHPPLLQCCRCAVYLRLSSVNKQTEHMGSYLRLTSNSFCVQDTDECLVLQTHLNVGIYISVCRIIEKTHPLLEALKLYRQEWHTDAMSLGRRQLFAVTPVPAPCLCLAEVDRHCTSRHTMARSRCPACSSTKARTWRPRTKVVRGLAEALQSTHAKRDLSAKDAVPPGAL